MPKTQPQKIEDWEKEFDKIVPADLEIDGWIVNLRPVILPIKSFIRQLLKSEKEKFKKVIEGWLKYELKEFNGSCGVCGGKLVEIRGKYPREPERKVCPTCLMEIRENVISNFGSEGSKEEIKKELKVGDNK